MGNPHPYKESCQQVLRRVFNGQLEANIDTELLQEVLYFYQRRRQLAFGLSLFDRLLALFPNPLPVTRDSAWLARDVLSRYPELEVRDALHVAVALEHGLEGIVSADRGFDVVPDITRFDPAAL